MRGLYVITDATSGGGHISIARAALAGGARIIQFRDKSGRPETQLLSELTEIRSLTRAAAALLIVNDRLDLALTSAADGIHVGPDDTPVSQVRRQLGGTHPAFLIGASCGSPAEAMQAQRDGADYIGAGAIFGTRTKLDAGAAIGLDALREIVRATPLPVAAIGGVNETNIRSAVAQGAAMACVVSAVASAGSAGGSAAEDAMTRATQRLIQAAGFRDD